MDYDKFQYCYGMLKRNGVKPLLAIVPFSKDENLVRGGVNDFWEVMRQLQDEGCSFAVHGYEHLYISTEKGLVCDRPLSEFAGVPYEKQLHMLLEGKRELEQHGIQADIFCPPGHSYDRNTMRALCAAGYKFLTDGRSIHPYMLEGIQCIPADSAWRLHKIGLLTICMHSNENTETDIRKLESFLQKHHSDVISFQEAMELKTMPYTLCRIEEKIAMYSRRILLSVIAKVRR
jgi:predicted deacetylase